MYFVYILESKKDGKFYTGITNDLKRRLSDHNKGKSSTPSTKNRGPFIVIYSEKVENRKIARKREKYLKSGSGREFIRKYNPE
ncbi:GIY-YIG nuclease family protein [Candidatus Wolfebacteria bacterium]|nr:GIY-YIG nuclease family protein [Candidatus Wolfebacteria bacterium]